MQNRINSFIKKAEAYGGSISPDTAEKLLRYQDKVAEVNNSFNLTAITDPEEMEIKHLLDSLTCAILPEIKGEVADVGSGPGFPGAVIAAVRPECSVTLIEATDKKLQFSLNTCRELGIKAKGVHGRSEELGRKELRERFDTVTARAVAAMASLCEYCLPLLKVGGYMVAMKGAGAAEELQEAENAIKLLGGGEAELRSLTLPDGSERALVLVKKVAPTPEMYPRSGKNIRKSPL